MKNKKGMTLVELLVYMVLAALLLAPVIMLVQNSSVNMARDAVNVNLRMTGRELLNIIYDDLKNTGYKLDPSNFKANDSVSYMDLAHIKMQLNGAATAADTAARLVTIRNNKPSALDSSSFRSVNISNSYYDELTVRKGKLTDAGAWVAGGIDTITYFVDDKNDGKLLKRKIKNKDGEKTITLARNVEALKFRYSGNLDTWYDTFKDNAWAGNDGVANKSNMQYIKVIIVQKDPKKLSATKSTTINLFDGIAPIVDNTSQALYERHEIVIPIPNNGLFP